MSVIAPVPASRAKWWQRLVFWQSKRMLGQVPEPAAVMAHHGGVLVAHSVLELAMKACKQVPSRLKHLAELRAATLIGCPF